MTLQQRINAFARLGAIMQQLGSETGAPGDLSTAEKEAFDNLELEIVEAHHYNGWFTETNVRQAIGYMGQVINLQTLTAWMSPYLEKLSQNKEAKTIGLVMAGNVPAVGFHDWMSVLITGNKVLAKLSSDDKRLIPALSKLLTAIEPQFEGMSEFTSGQLKGMDAIIATGSNNSARYFEYYFGKYPHIIRKNRNGVAVLSGKENNEELQLLTNDIFSYYGMGCRNVAHLFVPENYDFTRLLDACQTWSSINENHKYFNNYEYNKAIYLVNSTPHLDAGNLLVTESTQFASPVSVLHFEYYRHAEEVQKTLVQSSDRIQCVISSMNLSTVPCIPIGNSQKPALWDYADGLDTIEFLTGL